MSVSLQAEGESQARSAVEFDSIELGLVRKYSLGMILSVELQTCNCFMSTASKTSPGSKVSILQGKLLSVDIALPFLAQP